MNRLRHETTATLKGPSAAPIGRCIVRRLSTGLVDCVRKKNPAHSPRLNGESQFLRDGPEPHLEDDTKFRPVGSTYFQHLVRALEIDFKRLLNEHVFSSVGCGNCHIRMTSGRDEDVDHIDIGSF